MKCLRSGVVAAMTVGLIAAFITRASAVPGGGGGGDTGPTPAFTGCGAAAGQSPTDNNGWTLSMTADTTNTIDITVWSMSTGTVDYGDFYAWGCLVKSFGTSQSFSGSFSVTATNYVSAWDDDLVSLPVYINGTDDETTDGSCSSSISWPSVILSNAASAGNSWTYPGTSGIPYTASYLSDDEPLDGTATLYGTCSGTASVGDTI